MTAAIIALLLSAADAQLVEAARAYVVKSSAKGVKFDVQIGAQKGDWAVLRTLNAHGARGEPLDGVEVWMHRVKGKWQGAIMGTAITDDDLAQLGAPKLKPKWPPKGPRFSDDGGF